MTNHQRIAAESKAEMALQRQKQQQNVCASDINIKPIHHAELTLHQKADPHHQRCLPHFQPVTSRGINYSEKQWLRQRRSRTRASFCSDLHPALLRLSEPRPQTESSRKSYILSEALNASLAVSRSSPLLLCLCVCVCVCVCV